MQLPKEFQTFALTFLEHANVIKLPISANIKEYWIILFA